MKSLINFSREKWIEEGINFTYPDLNQEQREAIRMAMSTYFMDPIVYTDETYDETYSKDTDYLINLLLPRFSRRKAELIATTEITRMLAYYAQVDGERMEKEYSIIKAISFENKIKVYKLWITYNDSEVCPICKSLEGKYVEIYDLFTENIFIPPAHEGFRCRILATNYRIEE